MRFAALALVALLCSHVSAEAAPKAKPWEKLENVTFKPQRWDDGDSFHVLNVAGPRGSKEPGVGAFERVVLDAAMGRP